MANVKKRGCFVFAVFTMWIVEWPSRPVSPCFALGYALKTHLPPPLSLKILPHALFALVTGSYLP